MHGGVAVCHIPFLNHGGFDYIDALFLHVEFHESVVAGLLVGDGLEFYLVQAIHIADVAQRNRPANPVLLSTIHLPVFVRPLMR